MNELGKERKSYPWSMVITLLLLSLVLVVQGWFWYTTRDARAAAKQFKVVTVRTNGLDGIGIVEKDTGRPLWSQFSIGGQGKPDTFNYFFEGRNILNVYCQPGKSPRFEVLFYSKDGKHNASWFSREQHGFFSERYLYQQRPARMEVWVDEAWRIVEKKDGIKGILVDGQWRPIALTNGVWTLVTDDSSIPVPPESF